MMRLTSQICWLLASLLLPVAPAFAEATAVAEAPVVVAQPAPAPPPVDDRVTLEVELAASLSALFSVPLDLEGLDLGAWLVKAGLSSRGIHGWDAQGQKYVPLHAVRPGQGFLLARGPGKISVSGRRVVAELVEVPLAKGWNLLGVPYQTALPLASLRVVCDGQTEAYPAAAEKKWVGGVNELRDGKTSPSLPETALLEPWHGYWLYAYQPCLLVIPALQEQPAVPEDKGKRQRNVKSKPTPKK